MSNNSSSSGSIGFSLFFIYLGLKLAGYFSAWSYWWLLLPLIPFIGAAIEAGSK